MSARVLVVVEDDVEMRQLIKFMLQSEDGIEIIGEVATSEEAIALAGRQNSHPIRSTDEAQDNR